MRERTVTWLLYGLAAAAILIGAGAGFLVRGGLDRASDHPSIEGPESATSAHVDRTLDPAALYSSLARLLLAFGGVGAEARATELYGELIQVWDADHEEARAFLGYVDFQVDLLGRRLESWEEPIPESIANRRGYDFLDAVSHFHAKRWLTDEGEIALAALAISEMREHERLLRVDHEYRCADQIRAVISQDPYLKDYNYTTRWARPYLICYSSSDRLSTYELLKEPDPRKREEMLAELEQKRAVWERILDEKAAIYQQLYTQFLADFGERFGLLDLMEPWGGREDYGPGARSFEDGVPLVVWVFTDQQAFLRHHREVTQEGVSGWVAGYFRPSTGWVYAFDNPEDPSQRRFEISKSLALGTYQLLHWFTRQRNAWAHPRYTQDFFGAGLAGYLGSVKMDKQRELEFIGVSAGRLRGMQEAAEQFEQHGRTYPIFPAAQLTGFDTYQAVGAWGAEQWGISHPVALSTFYQQAWAFVYFLNDYEDGKYREGFFKFFEAVVARETGMHRGRQIFARAFDLEDQGDWDDLEAAWVAFVREDLLKRDVSPYLYAPPARDDWGD